MIFDVAVVTPTILRPELGRAVRSVFAQDFPGSIQILVGIDARRGDAAVLDALRADCPPNRELSIIDLGYSTAKRNGGLYRVRDGGALRTILSYCANSRYLAYLDDDCWWAASHLSDLLRCVEGRTWAYSYRWYVDPDTQQPLFVDEWESVGPGRGHYRRLFNGFVDTNCLMLDKLKCHWLLPAWSVPATRKGTGVDRTVFRHLCRRDAGVCTGAATAYYVFRREDRERILSFRQDGAGPSAQGASMAMPPDAG